MYVMHVKVIASFFVSNIHKITIPLTPTINNLAIFHGLVESAVESAAAFI